MTMVRLSFRALVVCGALLGAAPWASGQVEVAKFAASGGAQELGRSVSISDDRLVAGAPYYVDPTLLGYSGAAYVFERQSDGTWMETAKLVPNAGGQNFYFGHSAAIDGDRLVVGVSRQGKSKSAYVYERQSDASWSLVAVLQPGDDSVTAPNQGFGHAVSISGDRVVVGDPGKWHLLLGVNVGAAYVFERQSDGTWPEVAKLQAGDAANYDELGWSVAISGERVLAGAHYSGGIFTGSGVFGAAYVFERHAITGAWSEAQKLEASDESPGDQFAHSVSMSGDRLAIGAVGNDDLGSDSGSAYVFERQGGAWVEVAKLLASEGATSGAFGSILSLSGHRLAVGAVVGGNLYMFERQADGSWPEVATLKASDYGSPVFPSAVSVDSGRLVVSDWHSGGSNSGVAYVFDYCATIYGQGCPGSTPLTPRLNVSCPSLGGTVQVDIFHQIAAANVFLFLGTSQASLPMGAGCYLNVVPAAGPIGPLPLSFSATIPANAPLVTVMLQAFLEDGAAPTGFSSTNGVVLPIQ